MAIALALLPLPRKAYAQCVTCSSVCAGHNAVRNEIIIQHELTRDHITREFSAHRSEFEVLYFFREHILAAMMMMTEQLIATGMHQMMILGAFIDAEQQLETQRLLQKLAAQAHKDYHPSIGMCEFGTLAGNLPAAYHHAEFTAVAFSQRSQNRQYGKAGRMAARFGKATDKRTRLQRFISTFCRNTDNNRQLDAFPSCPAPGNGNANKDINYTRLIDYPLTLEFDLSSGGVSGADHPAIFSMADYLYANDVLDFYPDATIAEPENQVRILDMRQVIAKRSVAENSFNNIVAMKARSPRGSNQVKEYMENIYRTLGVIDDDDNPALNGTDEDELLFLLGSDPSYHAQMEILTKKLYQRMEFYTNLHDTPANVDRKGAAIRAISLMQNMDKFKSQLRQEMILSVLLELSLADEQDRVQRLIGNITD